MKPSVTLLAGYHITAADKRNILGCIAFMRDKDPETWSDNWMGLPKSPKSYGLAPDPEQPGRYSVLIREKYRDDMGRRKDRQSSVIVEVKGVEPLPLPAYATQDLFAPKAWETET